jgi:RimJ/RimL family protein N-acetyltransferase
VRPPAQIATARLRLRRLAAADAATIFAAYAQDPEVTRYLMWRPHRSIAETQAYVESRIAAWTNDEAFTYALTLPEASRAIGAIELRPAGHRVEFGYVLARAHWGNGYVSEALRTLVDWALAQPGVWRAWSLCDAENLASARVMEKAGLDFEAVLRGWTIHPNIGPEPRDCRVYARLRERRAPAAT